MKTLLLDTVYWDLVLDANGNIAVAASPYALAQDVASAVKLFIGELYYNTRKGIPYFEEILGHLPPLSVLTQYLSNAALTVPELVTAQTVITGFESDTITGAVQFTDSSGAIGVVTF